MSHRLITPPRLVATALSCAMAVSAVQGAAAVEQKRSYNLPSGDAATTLNQFAGASGQQIVFMMEKVKGERTNAVAGDYAARDALDRMLAGTGLSATRDPATGAFVVSRKRTAETATSPEEVGPVSDPQPKPPPKPMKSPRTLLAALAGLLFAGSAAGAEIGSIHGRVLDGAAGRYVENAQIAVRPAVATAASAALHTVTDSQGYFRLTAVPAGEVTVRVSYTGLPPLEKMIRVAPGRESTLELTLGGGTGDARVLDTFTVATSREMSATALAINTQRFAKNIKSVVAVDELGFTGDNSIAGAMKFLPGVDLEPDGLGYANGITLSGAPSANVPVTYGGFDLTTSSDGPANNSVKNQRTVNLAQLSLGSISRIEINRSPTPDSPGSALAGSVNFVPKSAFELVKPQYTFQTFFTVNQDKLSTLGRTTGIWTEKERQIFPGGSFGAVVPVSPRFGFTLSLNRSVSPRAFQQNWMRWNANWNNATQSFLPTPLNPDHYNVYEFELNDFAAEYTRQSLNATLDTRLYEGGTLTAAFTQAYNEQKTGQRQIRWSFSNGSGFNRATATLTSVSSVIPANNNDTVLNNTYYIDQVDANRGLSLKFRHDGRVWRGELGASVSRSRRQNLDLERGLFFSQLYNFRPVNLAFADVQPWTVGRITASVNGVAVSPLDLGTFANAGNLSTTVTNNTGPATTVVTSLPPLRAKPIFSEDERYQINGSVGRDFAFTVPTTLKAGFDVTDWKRDTHMDPTLGTNGGGFLYNGTDVSYARFLNRNYDRPLPLGFGVPTTLDSLALGSFFKANRASFVQANPGADWQTAIANSKFFHERISAGYLRLDHDLLKNRLRLTYGLRYERTEDGGTGPFTDPTRNYQRNAAGQFINAAGLPVAPGVTPALRFNNGSLAANQLVWIERGTSAGRSYGSWFPSFNASYNVAENVITRVSYGETIGRPDVLNISPGYTGALDPTNPNPSIRVANPALKPWTSRNVGLSLEYYSPALGDLTLRGYRRFVRNAFSTLSLSPAQSGEVLSLYGITADEIPTNTLVTTSATIPDEIVTSGLEFSSRYSLDGLLPNGAKGFQVKASASRSTLTGGGATAAAFGSQNLYLVPYSVGLGLSYVHRFGSIALNGKWNARQTLNYIDPIVSTATSGVNVVPGTYVYNDAALRVDLDASVRLTRRLSLFINGRDINRYEQVTLQYAPTTPSIARNASRNVFQPVWSFGVKGKF